MIRAMLGKMRVAGIGVVAALLVAHAAVRAVPAPVAGGGQTTSGDTGIYFRIIVVSTEPAAQALVAAQLEIHQVEGELDVLAADRFL